MSLLHALGFHDWQTEAAVRNCDHAWTGPDLGANVVPWTRRPRHLGYYPGGPEDCFATLYQACARDGCDARRRHQATQPIPTPRDSWIDDGELPRAVPTEGR